MIVTCALVRPASSRLARDDCDDLSARSGGSGPLAGTPAPVLLLLFSSLACEGWLRLGMPSPLTGTASDDGVSANRQENAKSIYQDVNKLS